MSEITVEIDLRSSQRCSSLAGEPIIGLRAVVSVRIQQSVGVGCAGLCGRYAF